MDLSRAPELKKALEARGAVLGGPRGDEPAPAAPTSRTAYFLVLAGMVAVPVAVIGVLVVWLF